MNYLYAYFFKGIVCSIPFQPLSTQSSEQSYVVEVWHFLFFRACVKYVSERDKWPATAAADPLQDVVWLGDILHGKGELVK